MGDLTMKIQITVKKIACYKDLMRQYENPIEHACDMKMDQVFFTDGVHKPGGMCDSAWEVMLPFVRDLASGKDNFFDGWMKNPKSAMISCNDGFRPVSFYLEVVEE